MLQRGIPIAALLLVLAALGPADAQPTPNVQLYGGIEIGAKGVRAVVVQVTEVVDGVFEHRRVMAKTDNPALGYIDDKGAFRADALQEATKFIKSVHDEMCRVHKVPRDHIVIVGSSGLPAEAPNLKDLQSRIRAITGKDMRLVTAQQEVPLSIIGIVPLKLQADALLFDVGAGATRGGFYQQGSNAQVAKFTTFSFPVGTVKLAKNAAAKRSSPAEFKAEVRCQCELLVGNPLYDLMPRRPGIVNRDRIFLNGGIVWAMTTILYPQHALQNHVELQADDIEKFAQMLNAKPGRIPVPSFANIKNEAAHQRAENEFRDVRDNFTLEQLVAGTEILRSLSTTCKFADNNKRLFFRRDGYISWIAALAENGDKLIAK